MIIGVSDPDNFTFSQQLIDHWVSCGHTVKQSLYHEEKFVAECDVVFYDFASINVQQLAKFGKKPKKCIVRAIDVENYMNYHMEFNYDLIDHFIFLNRAQYQMLKDREFKCPESKVHIIPPGINMNKYTLSKKSEDDTTKIVFVGRLWIGKNVLEAIQIAKAWWELGKNVELYIRGDKPDPRWWKKRVEHEISSCKFPVFMDNRVDDMNEYLEDKDVMLVPSFKEAFSYVTAEALAKGIPVLTANWYGAKEVWPEWMIYNNIQETFQMYETIREQKTPEHLRLIVKDKYDEQIMFERIDALL